MIQVGRTMSKTGAKAPVDEDVPVGPCRLSNSVLIWAAMFFSMSHLSSAAEATSTISSLKSTFVTIAFGPSSLSWASEPESEPVGASTSSTIASRDSCGCVSGSQGWEGVLRVAVVPAVLDRHRSTRHRTIELSWCGASAVSRRKCETVLYAEEQRQ